MNKRKFFLSMVITMAILVICYCAWSLLSANQDFQDALDGGSANKTNVLVVGVDKDGVRSDVNMLFSIDAKAKTIRLLSIPRDTRVKLPNGSYSKINACIGKENGEALLIQTVKELTGLPVNDFCKVNIAALRNIIDILGGVSYDVPINMDYDDPVQDLHIHLKAGPQTLNGEQAEGLLRFRSGYANADLGRINTQQDFIKELLKQKMRPKYIFKAFPVVKEITENLETDMSAMYIMKYAWAFRDSEKTDFASFTLPGTGKTIRGVSYYICDKNATESLVRTEFRSETGKKTASDGNSISEKVIE